MTRIEVTEKIYHYFHPLFLFRNMEGKGLLTDLELWRHHSCPRGLNVMPGNKILPKETVLEVKNFSK